MDPEDQLRGVTSCLNRRLETSHASTTRTEETQGEVQPKHPQAKTHVRGPREVHHDSRQVEKAVVTEALALEYGPTLGRERGDASQYCLPTSSKLTTLSAGDCVEDFGT